MNEYFEKIPDVGSEFIYLENITDLLGELEITLGNKCYETEKILFKNVISYYCSQTEFTIKAIWFIFAL